MSIYNIIKVLCVILFILYTCFVVAIECITADKRGGHSLSNSVQESKLDNSFVAEYKIKNIPDSTKKILEKLGLLNIIDTLEIWVAKEHWYERDFLYFNTMKYSEKSYLTFKNPCEILEKKDSTILMKMILGFYPNFDMYIHRDSAHNKLVGLELGSAISDTLNIGVLLQNMKYGTEERLPERISLKLIYRNSNEEHRDRRSLWDRITYK